MIKFFSQSADSHVEKAGNGIQLADHHGWMRGGAACPLRQQILQANYWFYPQLFDKISAHRKDLIKKLLKANPNEQNSLKAVLQHPCLQNPLKWGIAAYRCLAGYHCQGGSPWRGKEKLCNIFRWIPPL